MHIGFLPSRKSKMESSDPVRDRVSERVYMLSNASDAVTYCNLNVASREGTK
jgi:hypothetical protein